MGVLYRIVGMVVWFITALASINIGLSVFGLNLLEHPFVLTNMQWIIEPAVYVIGISGAISLGMMIFHLCCDGCGGCQKAKGKCTC